MQKVKVSRKTIANQGWNLGIGYCQADYILSLYRATLCAVSSQYGWACDYYPITDHFGIVTGYNVDSTSDEYLWNLSNTARERLAELNNQAGCYLSEIDKEALKDDLVKFLADVKNGNYDREWFVEYCGHVMGRGYSKKDAVKDFYKSRQKLVADLRLDFVPKLKDCSICYN